MLLLHSVQEFIPRFGVLVGHRERYGWMEIMSEALVPVEPKPVEAVPVDDVEEFRLHTSKTVSSILKKQGLVGISASTLRDLKKIGQHIAGLGVVPTVRGSMFITQQRAAVILEALQEQSDQIAQAAKAGKNLVKIKAGEDEDETIEVAPAEALSMLAKAYAQLASAQNESHKLTLESSGGKYRKSSNLPPVDPPKNKSFPPGTLVQVNVGKGVEVKVDEKVVATPPSSS
jgi:hypothetical protein